MAVAILIPVGLVVAWVRAPHSEIAAFRKAIAAADRIVVRDGGFNCCGPVDDQSILFEVTDPAEIESVRANLEFAGTTGPCMCCGFPGIDWYQGTERIALTAVQHGKAIRWRGWADLRLTDASGEWFAQWLVAHGVKKEEIEIGLGGPRSDARRRALQAAQGRAKSTPPAAKGKGE